VALIVVGGAVAWSISRGGGAGSSDPRAGTGNDTSQVGTGEPELVAVSVAGAGHPLMAMFGSGERAAAFAFPPGVTIVQPGAGELTTDELSSLDGPSQRLGMSNTMGAWAGAYGVMDLPALGRIVDELGGITVVLADVYTVGDAVLGPGEERMEGREVAIFLNEEGPDAYSRWQAVLGGLLAVPPPDLGAEDFTEVDDPETIGTVWEVAAGARVQPFPTRVVGGTAVVPGYGAIDERVSETWGGRRPTPAILQNGNGRPGSGEQAAELLVPAGFRVTLSQNADGFDYPFTQVVANGENHVGEARRARRALEVGRVGVSGVPSGIGDITIVVGKDFTA
jgi:hypothetical protein